VTNLLDLLFQGASLGMVYALIALGLVIVYKGSGVFNLAHGELVMAGAYLVVAAAASMPYGVAVLVAAVVLVAVGLLVERLFLRRMLGEAPFSVVMVTLGLATMVRAVVAMVWGTRDKGYADWIGPGVVHAGDVVLAKTGLWTIAAGLALLGGLAVFYRWTGWGLALRATAQHQEAALAQGIDVRRVFALSWTLAALLAVAGGIFLGAFPRPVGLSMGFVALNALPAMIIGGFDSLPGAVVGGVSVGIIQVLAAGYLGDVAGGNLQDVLPYVVMLAVLLVRPYGLFGTPEIERV
jgi:branched-chain amino acid transport system permease protein